MDGEDRGVARESFFAHIRRHGAAAMRFLRALLAKTLPRLAGFARRIAGPRVRRVALVAGRDLAAALGLGLLALGALDLCFERVEPGTIGVRQVNWGERREIAPADHSPGLYFGPRPFYSWHHLDARTQVLELGPEASGSAHPPLELRSASGTTVEVSVSVPYRILPGSAHQIVQDGLRLAWPLRVKATIEKVVVQELSKLDTEGFADPERRRAACERALARLAGELRPHHVAAEGVFVRGFRYAETYEKKKREEQLAGQILATNEVLAELKARRLENEALAQALEQERDALAAERDRQLAAEADRWQNQVLEEQKIQNQFLAQEIEKRKRAVLERLAREFHETKLAERDRPLEEAAAAKRALAQRVAGEEARRAAGLARELGAAQRDAQAAILELRTANELEALGLARVEEALAAELELATLRERIEGEEARLTMQRAARDLELAGRRDAERAEAALVAEGRAALSDAETLRDRLEAEALALPGARMVLARSAAANLRLERVTLDANDPRVPTVLDLDALVALLIGARD